MYEYDYKKKIRVAIQWTGKNLDDIRKYVRTDKDDITFKVTQKDDLSIIIDDCINKVSPKDYIVVEFRTDCKREVINIYPPEVFGELFNRN